MDHALLYAFGLTLFAGLSTGIGSILSLVYKKFDSKFLGIMLGFSAGVMLFVSFVEIFQESKHNLSITFGPKIGYTYAALGFFGGIILMLFIEKLMPSFEKILIPKKKEGEETTDQRLFRLGLFSALALAIHNFPEGLATFLSALNDPAYGLSIAIAIAIHNIPEGIAVAIPIYYATKSRKRAFWYSFLSGLTEPLGAVIGYFVLLQFFDESVFGIVFASVAGMMVYISLNELIPTAQEYAGQKLATLGIIAGMMVMALSLILLA